MGKKSVERKKILGNRMKRSRRIPVLAILRTHRRIEYNTFKRDWRHRKLKLKV